MSRRGDMSEWKKYRLGDICQTNKSQYSAKENWENFLYLDTGNITKGIVDDIQEFDSFVNLPSRARRKVEDGDIIYSSVRPNQEHYGYISNPPINLLVSTGFVVISANKDIINPLFLYNYLTRTKITKYLQAIGEQSVCTYPAIKPSDIENLIVKIPSIKIQIEIASILSSLDDKIAVNKKICENLEAQAQALFKHWFIDFAPFKDGNFVESELGLIPEGWRVGTLGEIAEITMGQSPAGSSYNEKGEGIIFYQGRTEFGFRYPSVRLYTTEPKRFAEPLSTLLSVRAPVGDINVATDKCCIGRGLASIKSNNNFHSYIFYLLQSLKKRFDVYNGEGTVFGSINKDTLNGLRNIIPSNSIILDFEEIVEEMDKKILGCHQENLRLSTLRDTLLPKLMSGAIKV